MEKIVENGVASKHLTFERAEELGGSKLGVSSWPNRELVLSDLNSEFTRWLPPTRSLSLAIDTRALLSCEILRRERLRARA